MRYVTNDEIEAVYANRANKSRYAKSVREIHYVSTYVRGANARTASEDDSD